MSLTAPVVDTNVLVDMAVASRQRHSVASRLTALFEREGIEPWVPAHAIFEFHAAIVAEGLAEPSKPTVFPSDEHPLSLHVIYIDKTFFDLFLKPPLPVLKGADLIFVLLAVGERRPLISEDCQMLRATAEAGGEALTTSEYLAAHDRT